MIKSWLKKICLAVLLLPLLSGYAGAAESKIDTSNMFAHFNSALGYMILCPKEPVYVLTAAEFYQDPTIKGDVIIFENQEYTVKKAWVIIKNGPEGKDLPDFNTLTPESAETLLTNMRNSAGYEGVALVNVKGDNRGVFAITAKEVEIDTTGDGVPDTIATADNQVVKVFFRGANGDRYLAELIDNPTPREESVSEFQQCLSTFNELSKDDFKKLAATYGKNRQTK